MKPSEFNHYLQLIKSGNDNERKYGFSKIYAHYYKKVVFTVYVELKNYSDAEDVATSLLVTIFANAGNYGYIANPNAWIFRAAKHALINYKKSESKYVYTELIDDVYPQKSSETAFKTEFKEAIQKLTERQREIVLLHFAYGFNIKEVVKMLNISVSTANRDIIVIRESLKYLNKN